MTLAQAVGATWQTLEPLLAIAPKSAVSDYARIRYHYLRLETELLGEFLKSLDDNSNEGRICAALGRLRWAIRQHSLTPEFIENERSAVSGLVEGLWAAEFHMVLGMAYETAGDQSSARNHYLQSQVAFASQGELQKAIFAELNAIAALSRIHPEKRLLYEYRSVTNRAKALGFYSPAATALLNLSREYQLMSAFNLGLRTINEAIELLLQYDYGTYQYFLAVAHRCHLLVEIQQTELAKIDFEEIACCELPEALAVATHLRETIREFRDLVPQAVKDERLPKTWEERKRKFELLRMKNKMGLSQLEENLIVTLQEKPLTLRELALSLYGENLSLQHTEDRVKQILRRLRLKAPRLVTRRDGKYAIN